MPAEFNIVVKMPFLARWQPRKLDAATRATIYPAVDEAGLLLQREVTQRTPVGATSAARGSIQQATEMVRGRHLEVRGQVTSALPYILPLEHGSRPHWAPIGPLKLWVKRKLGEPEGVAYAIRAAIAKRGTKGAHMFRDGVAASEGRIQRILKDGAEAWTRHLKGG
jgi:hypothetical protein